MWCCYMASQVTLRQLYATTVNWVQASGKATLYSFALMHQVYHPGFASEVLYIIAQVDLEEGLRILTNLVGCSSSDLQIGKPSRGNISSNH